MHIAFVSLNPYQFKTLNHTNRVGEPEPHCSQLFAVAGAELLSQLHYRSSFYFSKKPSLLKQFSQKYLKCFTQPVSGHTLFAFIVLTFYMKPTKKDCCLIKNFLCFNSFFILGDYFHSTFVPFPISFLLFV